MTSCAAPTTAGARTSAGCRWATPARGARPSFPPRRWLSSTSAAHPASSPNASWENLKRICSRGYDDVEVIVHTARKDPYKTAAREAIAQATIRAAERVFGTTPLIQGVSIQDIIMLAIPHPAVLSGFGAPENNLHAPNENMPVDRYIQGIQYTAAIMHAYARETSKEER